MSRIADYLARHRWPLFLLPLVLATFPLVAVSPDGRGSRLAIVVFAACLLGFLFVIGLNLSGRDPDADARARSLDPDPVGAALLSRWLRRSKYFRFVGGFVGTIVGVSFVDGTLAPVILTTLAGIVVGGGLAEVHSLRRPSPGPRNADISIRRFTDYAAPIDVGALALAGCGALALAIAAVVVDGPERRTAMVGGLTAVAVVLATLAMQWLLVVRPRPAVSEDIRDADDLMRRLAATRGFARPGIALAAGLLAASLSTGGAGDAARSLAPVLWILVLVAYVASRQRQPRSATSQS